MARLAGYLDSMKQVMIFPVLILFDTVIKIACEDILVTTRDNYNIRVKCCHLKAEWLTM